MEEIIKISKETAYILFIIFLLKSYNFKNYNKNYHQKSSSFGKFYNNKTIDELYTFYKFGKMFPSLTPHFDDNPSNINEIFHARQIYISDVSITPEYIRYIRPLNKKKKKSKHESKEKNKIFIDVNILKKRPDQYNYKEFCKIALNEQLIDNKQIDLYNNPIISVILPSYNKQNILLKSIRSIQNQNFKNIEIIIVNDCSNDNSSEVFNYLLETDKRIRIFHHMKNLGVFRSRIDGILYSRGK